MDGDLWLVLPLLGPLLMLVVIVYLVFGRRPRDEDEPPPDQS